MVSQHSTDGRRLSTGSVSQAATNKSRLRLIVIQALVFSLFATLFVRLYYLQVVGGEEYHAQAASQSVREIVVQPQRGRRALATLRSRALSPELARLSRGARAPARR